MMPLKFQNKTKFQICYTFIKKFLNKNKEIKVFQSLLFNQLLSVSYSSCVCIIMQV